GLVPWIVAGGKSGGDCHDHGTGPLRTEEPVIIDVYPMSPSRYWGDCTRTVVNGAISDDLRKMHAAVLDARKSAIDYARAGVTAESVHEQTIAAVKRHGYEYGLPKEGDSSDYTALTHGTGHGIGLCVHEPILLDFGGPELLVGETVTVEPGLYRKSLGGVRVEDVVLIKENGCESFGTLYDGLDWKV
ncbi:MAG: M24 family metallopeptidase, partial [Thermoguttaceae bacterium]